MKKILFVNNNMHIGGVQKALVDLLKEIKDKYEITLLLFHKGGELISEIPEEVNVIEASPLLRFLGMTKDECSKGTVNKLFRCFFAVMTKIFCLRTTVKFMTVLHKKISGYDAVISFLHSGNDRTFYGGCNEFVVDKTDSPLKITFLHCDYSAVGNGSRSNRKIYSKFDRIVACSCGCKNSFVSCEPDFKDKVTVIPNCHDFEQIKSASNSGEKLEKADKFSVLTVARLGREKSVSRAVEAIAMLGEEKRYLHYYIVGDGAERSLIEKKISEHALDEIITLLGEKSNPYGFIASADLLLIPSMSEAAPMVIGEAACLGTPILTTRTSSAYEMTEEKGFGLVCENSIEGIRAGLELFISENNRFVDIKEKLGSVEFDNKESVALFDKILNEMG